MKRMPGLSAIHAAEVRVIQSRQETLENLELLRLAVRVSLARPATLAAVAGAAGVAGFLTGRRLRRDRPRAAVTIPSTTRSALVVLLGFAAAYVRARIAASVASTRSAR
jgi:hypothetical protein